MSGGGRLGRNPFEARRNSPKKENPLKTAEKKKSDGQGESLLFDLRDFALISIPAELFLFGLKTLLLAKDTFEALADPDAREEDASPRAPRK